MTLEDLVKIYKDYCIRQGLNPKHHTTHLCQMLCNIAEATQWLSKSKDPTTDRVVDLIQSVCRFYSYTDKFVVDFEDHSFPIILKKEKEPLVYIGLLADLFIRILIYISGNNWTKTFFEILESKALNDDATNFDQVGRFVNNRFGWLSKSPRKREVER